MAFKKIVWSKLAQLELENTLAFYIQQNGNANYCAKLLDEIEDLINTLSQIEFIGRLTNNKITRVIPMKSYLIYYEINKDVIEIVSFWDNRQDQNKQKVK